MIRKITILTLTTLMIITLSCFIGCVRNILPEVNTDSFGSTLMKEPPESGTPLDYNGIENISFMAYNLKHTPAYAVKMNSTINTKVVISYTQYVECYKDYKDGVMIVSDISTSSLVNTALQTCFTQGRAMWRKPKSPYAADWDGKNTEWLEEEPLNYSYDEYKTVYGLPCDEFSVYILNEETLTKWDNVVKNEDGTYSQTVYPDVETAARFYCLRMMVMGGLADLPTFRNIAITYTFTQDWKILKSETKELYGIKKGIINSDNCTAETTEVYSYNPADVDLSAYEAFFKNYVTKTTDGEIENEKEVTAVDCLSEAFGDILTEPKQLSADIKLADKSINAKIYVDLPNLDIRLDAGALKVYYTDGDVFANLYGIKIKTDVNGLTAIFAGDGLPETDTDSLLEELCNGEFVKTETDAKLTTELTLMGIKIPLEFAFDIEEDSITLDYAEINGLTVGEAVIDAAFRFDSGCIEALSDSEKANYAEINDCITTLYDFVTERQFRVNGEIQTEVNGGRLKVTADGDISVIDKKAYVDIAVDYNSITANCTIEYSENNLYIAVGDYGVKLVFDGLTSTAEKFATAYDALLKLFEVSFDMPEISTPDLATTVFGLIDALNVYNVEGNGFKWLAIGFGETAEIKIGGGEIQAVANLNNIAVNLAVTKYQGMRGTEGVKFFTEQQLCELYGYMVDAKQVVLSDKWDITYQMTVGNLFVSDGAEYTVNGNLKIEKSTDNRPIAVDLTLKVFTIDPESKNYIIDLVLIDNEIYLTASYYEAEAQNENYYPLRLKCTTETVSGLIKTCKRLTGLDLSFVGIVLPEFDLESSMGSLSLGALNVNSVISEYLKDIDIEAEGLALVINGEKIYGKQGCDITLKLNRTDAGNLAAQAENVTYNAAENLSISAGFYLGNEDSTITAPTDKYIDITTVNGLIDALIDSFAAEKDGKIELLDNYYFAGKISSDLVILKPTFDVAINLDVKNLVMTFTIGANSSLAINSGKYLTYVTIDFADSLMYMQRYQYEYYKLWFRKYSTPVITYRAMTLQEFADNYFDQIVYMTNMGDKLSSLIKDAINASDSQPNDTLYDIGSYVNDYSYNEAGNYYFTNLNGKNFLDALGEMKLKMTLDNNSIVKNIYGSVNIYITLNLDIDYENNTKPNNPTLKISDLKSAWQKEGYKTVIKTGVLTETSSLSGIIDYVQQ